MKKTILLPILLCLALAAQAQTITLKEKAGTQITYALSSIKTMTISSGSLTINLKDGTSSTYPLTDFQTLNLSTSLTDVYSVKPETDKLILYPSPVHNRLTLIYRVSSIRKVEITIMSANGNVIYKQSVTTSIGINTIDIPVSGFANGLYICLVNSGKEMVTNKFLKL